jgi:hypothetical protein
VRRLVPALLAAIACAGCTPPIFDPSASLAAKTLEQIPPILDTGYLDNLPEDFNFRDDTYTFMPERAVSTLTDDRGFVIRTRNGRWNQICYVWDSGGPQWIRAGWEYSTDDPMLPQWVVSLKDGPYLGVVSLDSAAGRAAVFFANGSSITESTSTDIAPVVDTGLGLTNTPQVVGVSVNGNTAAWDGFRVLVRYGNLFSEGVVGVDWSGFSLPFAATFAPPEYDLSTFLGTPWHLRYFHDAWNTRSFAQSYDSRKETWKTWVWSDNSGAGNGLSGITHRLDAVLTHVAGNSFLFSAEDQIGRVYEYDGTAAALVAEFPLGSLRFIGDAYVYGDWRMLFSRCLLDTSKRMLRFQVRSILTDDLVTTFPP